MNQLVLKKKEELNKKKKKGFTLIELIIVIAIIAIIAAMAIPKFGSVKKQANLTSDQANAKIIATAVSQAISDGLTITDGEATDSSNYAKYIDGKKIPAVKSDDTKKFYVYYSDADGTKVFIGEKPASGDEGQVYPAK